MSTKLRRQAIIDIIAENEVARQEELVIYLKQKGYDVTQATVSRDIKELKLVKVKGEKQKFKYAMPKTQFGSEIDKDKMITLLKTFVIDIKRAQNLIIVKTLEGNGSACGMAIDNLSTDKIVGSIAGDDTLLIVCDDEFNAEDVVDLLKEIIYKW